jgi:hypothetical protein
MSEQFQINYDNLYPGTKFTIENSKNVYTLLGYTSNRNIVYFDDNNTNYINNLIVTSKDVIDKVVFFQKSNYSEKTFKH